MINFRNFSKMSKCQTIRFLRGRVACRCVCTAPMSEVTAKRNTTLISEFPDDLGTHASSKVVRFTKQPIFLPFEEHSAITSKLQECEKSKLRSREQDLSDSQTDRTRRHNQTAKRKSVRSLSKSVRSKSKSVRSKTKSVRLKSKSVRSPLVPDIPNTDDFRADESVNLAKSDHKSESSRYLKNFSSKCNKRSEKVSKNSKTVQSPDHPVLPVSPAHSELLSDPKFSEIIRDFHLNPPSPTTKPPRGGFRNSLAYQFPHVARRVSSQIDTWKLTAKSSRKLNFRCSSGHLWQAKVNTEVENDDGCKFCAVPLSESLAGKRPELAMQWHPTQNGNLLPANVRCVQSLPTEQWPSEKFWWLCAAHEEHVWESDIRQRIRTVGRCPFCSNKRVCSSNSLRTVRPMQAAMWHSTKNAPLTPETVLFSSQRTFWWKCIVPSCRHEWEAVNKPNVDQQCPTCTPKLEPCDTENPVWESWSKASVARLKAEANLRKQRILDSSSDLLAVSRLTAVDDWLAKMMAEKRRRLDRRKKQYDQKMDSLNPDRKSEKTAIKVRGSFALKSKVVIFLETKSKKQAILDTFEAESKSVQSNLTGSYLDTRLSELEAERDRNLSDVDEWLAAILKKKNKYLAAQKAAFEKKRRELRATQN
eukprot:246905_1